MIIIKSYAVPFGPAIHGAWLWIRDARMIAPKTDREWNNAAAEYSLYAALNN